MQRVIAGIAAATVIMSVTASPAHAVPAAHVVAADPVTALKRQFVAGIGVRFTDVSTLIEFVGNTSFLKRTGSFQFGPAGMVASDVTATLNDEAIPRIPISLVGMLRSKDRTIRIGTTSYYSGGPWAAPKGKTWLKHPHGMSAGWGGWCSQLVNVAEAATLKALITRGKRTGRTYAGAISFGALEKVSPWLRNATMVKMSADTKAAVLRFRLTVGADQLPQRLVTDYPASTHGGVAAGEEGRRISVETNYTGWGNRVNIKAPPASEVAVIKRARLG
ncbi:hypothetical protein ACSDR0_47405 [Streptosporangium sp. G11]|uniref:hypothetical protein n=1 Tax=Streptosporangium sp. G11 TaxID=3436926 RepID=UPI003EBBC2A3